MRKQHYQETYVLENNYKKRSEEPLFLTITRSLLTIFWRKENRDLPDLPMS